MERSSQAIPVATLQRARTEPDTCIQYYISYKGRRQQNYCNFIMHDETHHTVTIIAMPFFNGPHACNGCPV